MLQKKIKILLIEDDRIEVIKFNRAISSEFSSFIISLASNGKEALSLLQTSIPDIILLDLNMPDTNGIDFLKSVNNIPKLKHIPIIVLTTSNNSIDIKECYRLGISGYLVKSLKYEDYEIKINAILKYWSLNEFIHK
ncbi:response regulator [uncultured Polaribacter sp.]|uniref:response regulator n=1 Tax=uncultured Polaribacter sp. TaxID=174711 RepID=UPI0030DDC592|tara:strand:+ start:1819 stop:2229 length:411 start_codon:yes stop_codon:yes gene_type:complete